MRKATLLMTRTEGGIGGVSLFSVFTKTNNRKISDMIEDCHIYNHAKNQVSADFHLCLIRRSVSPKFVELCMETRCGVKKQNHL